MIILLAGGFKPNELHIRGGVAQWVARLTRKVGVVGSSLEQETLPLLLSTG